MPDTFLRYELALALTGCLGEAKPEVRDSSAFAALVLSEVARTDRLRAWMSVEERDEVVSCRRLVSRKGQGLSRVQQHRRFRPAVAHAAGLVLQLALNPLTTKAQFDHMMLAVAAQVAQTGIAYWAGEPDRLARPVLFIAQRKLHTEAEWQAFFAEATKPQPLESWKVAFASELGIKRRHNVRAFLRGSQQFAWRRLPARSPRGRTTSHHPALQLPIDHDV